MKQKLKDMRKHDCVISIDKLTLCYRANDEIVQKLNECNELIDSDDCFKLVRVPSDEALFANSFHLMIKYPRGGGEQGFVERKFATLKTRLRSMEGANYVWLYVENWVFYEIFIVSSRSKCNWLSCVDYVANELELSLNNITDLHIALDTTVDFAKKIRHAQFCDDYDVILNGKVRSDKKEVLNEILHLQTGDQHRLRTLTIYINPKKQDGLSLKIYDKKRELGKSNKEYIPKWSGLKDKDYRVELTLKNEHLKEYYQNNGGTILDEALMVTLASQHESQELLFDMLYYFSNRLLRFRYQGKVISIFEL